MKYLLSSLPLIITIFAVQKVMTLLHKQSEKDIHKNEVRLPIMILWLGIIGTIFFSVILIATLVADDSLWTSLAFVPFTLLPFSLIVAYFNCVITFDDDSFTHKNFFGFKRTYSYLDITGITKGKDDILFVGKKKIRIDQLATGKNIFLSTVKKAMQKDGDVPNKDIPIIKNKLFNDNINNPGQFIFIYIFFTVIFLGMLIFFLFINPITDYSELYEYTITYSEYDIDGGDLLIYSSDNNSVFEISDYKKYMDDFEGFNQLEKGTVLHVFSTDTAEVFQNSDTECTVHILQDDGGRVYRSLENSNASSKYNYYGIIIFLSILFVAWILSIIVSSYVMCNAPKYPKLIRLFVKPEYIKSDSLHARKK